jgi:hypothetical protein
MALKFTTSYLEDSLALFRQYKAMTEKAMEQVTEEQLFETLDSEANSIALLVKHMAGKPDRRRDTEFEDPPTSRGSLLALWEEGWRRLFAALEPLTEADLSRTTNIRGEAHSVMQAINRQIGHYACHCGQIVFLAKHFSAGKWRSLSVPRGQSEEFNRRVRTGEASQR